MEVGGAEEHTWPVERYKLRPRGRLVWDGPVRGSEAGKWGGTSGVMQRVCSRGGAVVRLCLPPSTAQQPSSMRGPGCPLWAQDPSFCEARVPLLDMTPS